MRQQDLYKEIIKLEKEEQVQLMTDIFLLTSFDIVDIIKIKENYLKLSLERQKSLVNDGDNAIARFISNPKKKEENLKFAYLHLRETGTFETSKFWQEILENVTEEELQQRLRFIGIDKNLKSTNVMGYIPPKY